MIYRKEALENQSNKNFSNISLVRPFSKTLYIYLILLTTTLIATFLFTGEYTRYISVKGITGEFKHEVRQFEKSYDNQQAEQISLMV